MRARWMRGLLVLVTWAWTFVGSALAALALALVGGAPPTFEGIASLLNSRPYLASYLEIVGVGALPLAFSLLCRDSPQLYGLRRECLARSLALSVLLATPWLVPKAIAFFRGGLEYRSFGLSFPYNLWYALLGIFAYGPLEVFFVVWLIVNTDIALGSSRKRISPGLIITTLAFGLSHVITSPQAGVLNALSVALEFFLLGLVFKYTDNSVGPMVAWTLTNGQVLRLAISCLK